MSLAQRAKRERLLVWAMVAAYLVVIGIIHREAVQAGWILMGDEAIVVLRSGDLFSEATPLIGMPSSFSAWASGADPFHPGPSTLWLMGLGTSVFGTSEGVVVAVTWAFTAAVLITIVGVSMRVSGARLALVAMASLLLLQLSMPWASWNPLTPAVAHQLMLALLFVSWAIASGRHEFWPFWFGFGALVVHADLSFAPSVLPLLALVIATTARRILRARRAKRPLPLRRSTVIASAVVLLVTWMGPFIDAARNRGGNLRELYRAMRIDVPTEGISQVPEALGSLLHPSALPNIPQPLFVLGWLTFIALAGVGLARPRPGRRMLGATAALSAAGAIAGQTMLPIAARNNGIFDYPLWPASAFFGFAVFVLGVDGLRVLAADHLSAPTTRIPALLVALPLAANLILMAETSTVGDSWYLRNESEAVAPLVAQLDAELPDGTYRWQPLGGPDGVSVAHGLNLRLLDAGIEPRVQPPLGKYYGTQRVITGDEAGTLYVTFGPPLPPAEGAELVARWDNEATRDPALDGLRQRLADEIRDQPIRYTAFAQDFGIGTTVAGAGVLGDEPGPVDDRAVIALGKQFRAEPDDVVDLSDNAIVDLAEQRLIEPPSREGFLNDLNLLREIVEINVWLVAAEP